MRIKEKTKETILHTIQITPDILIEMANCALRIGEKISGNSDSNINTPLHIQKKEKENTHA
jgi:hypothetical protein